MIGRKNTARKSVHQNSTSFSSYVENLEHTQLLDDREERRSPPLSRGQWRSRLDYDHNSGWSRENHFYNDIEHYRDDHHADFSRQHYKGFQEDRHHQECYGDLRRSEFYDEEERERRFADMDRESFLGEQYTQKRPSPGKQQDQQCPYGRSPERAYYSSDDGHFYHSSPGRVCDKSRNSYSRRGSYKYSPYKQYDTFCRGRRPARRPFGRGRGGRGGYRNRIHISAERSRSPERLNHYKSAEKYPKNERKKEDKRSSPLGEHCDKNKKVPLLNEEKTMNKMRSEMACSLLDKSMSKNQRISPNSVVDKLVTDDVRSNEDGEICDNKSESSDSNSRHRRKSVSSCESFQSSYKENSSRSKGQLDTQISERNHDLDRTGHYKNSSGRCRRIPSPRRGNDYSVSHQYERDNNRRPHTSEKAYNRDRGQRRPCSFKDRKSCKYDREVPRNRGIQDKSLGENTRTRSKSVFRTFGKKYFKSSIPYYSCSKYHRRKPELNKKAMKSYGLLPVAAAGNQDSLKINYNPLSGEPKQRLTESDRLKEQNVTEVKASDMTELRNNSELKSGQPNKTLKKLDSSNRTTSVLVTGSKELVMSTGSKNLVEIRSEEKNAEKATIEVKKATSENERTSPTSLNSKVISLTPSENSISKVILSVNGKTAKMEENGGSNQAKNEEAGTELTVENDSTSEFNTARKFEDNQKTNLSGKCQKVDVVEVQPFGTKREKSLSTKGKTDREMEKTDDARTTTEQTGSKQMTEDSSQSPKDDPTTKEADDIKPVEVKEHLVQSAEAGSKEMTVDTSQSHKDDPTKKADDIKPVEIKEKLTQSAEATRIRLVSRTENSGVVASGKHIDVKKALEPQSELDNIAKSTQEHDVRKPGSKDAITKETMQNLCQETFSAAWQSRGSEMSSKEECNLDENWLLNQSQSKGNVKTVVKQFDSVSKEGKAGPIYSRKSAEDLTTNSAVEENSFMIHLPNKERRSRKPVNGSESEATEWRETSTFDDKKSVESSASKQKAQGCNESRTTETVSLAGFCVNSHGQPIQLNDKPRKRCISGSDILAEVSKKSTKDENSIGQRKSVVGSLEEVVHGKLESGVVKAKTGDEVAVDGSEGSFIESVKNTKTSVDDSVYCTSDEKRADSRNNTPTRKCDGEQTVKDICSNRQKSVSSEDGKQLLPNDVDGGETNTQKTGKSASRVSAKGLDKANKVMVGRSKSEQKNISETISVSNSVKPVDSNKFPRRRKSADSAKRKNQVEESNPLSACVTMNSDHDIVGQILKESSTKNAFQKTWGKATIDTRIKSSGEGKFSKETKDQTNSSSSMQATYAASQKGHGEGTSPKGKINDRGTKIFDEESKKLMHQSSQEFLNNDKQASVMKFNSNGKKPNSVDYSPGRSERIRKDTEDNTKRSKDGAHKDLKDRTQDEEASSKGETRSNDGTKSLLIAQKNRRLSDDSTTVMRPDVSQKKSFSVHSIKKSLQQDSQLILTPSEFKKQGKTKLGKNSSVESSAKRNLCQDHTRTVKEKMKSSEELPSGDELEQQTNDPKHLIEKWKFKSAIESPEPKKIRLETEKYFHISSIGNQTNVYERSKRNETENSASGVSMNKGTYEEKNTTSDHEKNKKDSGTVKRSDKGEAKGESDKSLDEFEKMITAFENESHVSKKKDPVHGTDHRLKIRSKLKKKKKTHMKVSSSITWSPLKLKNKENIAVKNKEKSKAKSQSDVPTQHCKQNIDEKHSVVDQTSPEYSNGDRDIVDSDRRNSSTPERNPLENKNEKKNTDTITKEVKSSVKSLKHVKIAKGDENKLLEDKGSAVKGGDTDYTPEKSFTKEKKEKLKPATKSGKSTNHFDRHFGDCMGAFVKNTSPYRRRVTVAEIEQNYEFDEDDIIPLDLNLDNPVSSQEESTLCSKEAEKDHSSQEIGSESEKKFLWDFIPQTPASEVPVLYNPMTPFMPSMDMYSNHSSTVQEPVQDKAANKSGNTDLQEHRSYAAGTIRVSEQENCLTLKKHAERFMEKNGIGLYEPELSDITDDEDSIIRGASNEAFKSFSMHSYTDDVHVVPVNTDFSADQITKGEKGDTSVGSGGKRSMFQTKPSKVRYGDKVQKLVDELDDQKDVPDEKKKRKRKLKTPDKKERRKVMKKILVDSNEEEEKELPSYLDISVTCTGDSQTKKTVEWSSVTADAVNDGHKVKDMECEVLEHPELLTSGQVSGLKTGELEVSVASGNSDVCQTKHGNTTDKSTLVEVESVEDANSLPDVELNHGNSQVMETSSLGAVISVRDQETTSMEIETNSTKHCSWKEALSANKECTLSEQTGQSRKDCKRNLEAESRRSVSVNITDKQIVPENTSPDAQGIYHSGLPKVIQNPHHAMKSRHPSQESKTTGPSAAKTSVINNPIQPNDKMGLESSPAVSHLKDSGVPEKLCVIASVTSLNPNCQTSVGKTIPLPVPAEPSAVYKNASSQEADFLPSISRLQQFSIAQQDPNQPSRTLNVPNPGDLHNKLIQHNPASFRQAQQILDLSQRMSVDQNLRRVPNSLPSPIQSYVPNSVSSGVDLRQAENVVQQRQIPQHSQFDSQSFVQGMNGNFMYSPHDHGYVRQMQKQVGCRQVVPNVPQNAAPKHLQFAQRSDSYKDSNMMPLISQDPVNTQTISPNSERTFLPTTSQTHHVQNLNNLKNQNAVVDRNCPMTFSDQRHFVTQQLLIGQSTIVKNVQQTNGGYVTQQIDSRIRGMQGRNVPNQGNLPIPAERALNGRAAIEGRTVFANYTQYENGNNINNMINSGLPSRSQGLVPTDPKTQCVPQAFAANSLQIDGSQSLQLGNNYRQGSTISQEGATLRPSVPDTLMPDGRRRNKSCGSNILPENGSIPVLPSNRLPVPAANEMSDATRTSYVPQQTHQNLSSDTTQPAGKTVDVNSGHSAVFAVGGRSEQELLAALKAQYGIKDPNPDVSDYLLGHRLQVRSMVRMRKKCLQLEESQKKNTEDVEEEIQRLQAKINALKRRRNQKKVPMIRTGHILDDVKLEKQSNHT